MNRWLARLAVAVLDAAAAVSWRAGWLARWVAAVRMEHAFRVAESAATQRSRPALALRRALSLAEAASAPARSTPAGSQR